MFTQHIALVVDPDVEQPEDGAASEYAEVDPGELHEVQAEPAATPAPLRSPRAWAGMLALVLTLVAGWTLLARGGSAPWHQAATRIPKQALASSVPAEPPTPVRPQVCLGPSEPLAPLLETSDVDADAVVAVAAPQPPVPARVRHASARRSAASRPPSLPAPPEPGQLRITPAGEASPSAPAVTALLDSLIESRR